VRFIQPTPQFLSNIRFRIRNLSRKFVHVLDKVRRFVLNPIFVFVVLQIVGVLTTGLWVLWFTSQSSPGLHYKYDVQFLVVGCVMGGIVILGTVALFVFAIRQLKLIRQQKSFVSTVTHEFRSPLASMQLGLETLQVRQLTPEMAKIQYGMMQVELNRLIHLVDQILVSARLDRGIKVFTEIADISWKDLFEDAFTQILHMDSKLAGRVEMSGDFEAKVQTSERAMHIVLRNILENSIKYSPPGSPIQVELLDLGNEYSCSITDQGMGIERRDLNKIFKIFARSSSAVRESIPGTGLGLYIVRNILSIMGGSIAVNSKGKGKGSQFKVRVPKVWVPL
jgi:signal transduction histidine kinase